MKKTIGLNQRILKIKYRYGGDDVIELISINEAILRHKRNLSFMAMQVFAYNTSWDSKFSVKQITEYSLKTKEELITDIPFSLLTKNQLIKLGFQTRDNSLFLTPLDIYNLISDDTVLTSIDGSTVQKKLNNDLECRFGCVAYGFKIDV